jgi:hypothetical protein
MRKNIWPLFFLLIFVVACNLPASSQPAPADVQASPEAPASLANAVAAATATELPPSPTPEPTPTPTPTPIPHRPVGLGEGLASLDTYHLVITTRSQSTDPGDRVETVMDLQQSHPQDAQVVKNISTTSSSESSTPESSESTSYQIGLETCSISDGEVEFDTLDPLEKEMASIFNRLMDMLAVVENPQYLGDETVNGIPAHHFSFSLGGLGSQSGAEATANLGEYWLAVDGQYLVKYAYLVELRTSPQDVNRQEYLLELKEANQPLTIAFPAECQAAQNSP